MTSRLFLECSIPDLLERLTTGEISYHELADASVVAVDEMEAGTLGWVCFDPEILRSAGDQGTTRGEPTPVPRLSGMPFGAKDIFNTTAFPTQMGSPIWKAFTPGNNARVVDSILWAGGRVAGKTVTAEFAVHALNETLNPHDPTKTPGTSSSGSAAVVATGMVPFALASQTAGSIIRPASFCGAWGMKPSFGMIPRTGVLKTTDSLDTIGFIAAHGKSLRPILDSTRVRGPNYPLVFKEVDARGARPKEKTEPWRVGFVRTHTWDGAKRYARQAMEELANEISKEEGFDVDEVLWPEELQDTHDTHSTIYTKSLSYYFKNEAEKSSYVSPIMAEMILAGEQIEPAEFWSALRRQERICASLDSLLAPYDMVLSLATSSSAPERGDEELPDPSLIWTLGHVPSISAPTFRCPDDLPFGIQFISRKWNDYLLLECVEELIDRGVIPAGSEEIRPR